MQLVNSVNCLFMSFQKIMYTNCATGITVGILVEQLHSSLSGTLYAEWNIRRLIIIASRKTFSRAQVAKMLINIALNTIYDQP